MLIKDDVVKSVKVNKGVISEINAVAESDCGTLIEKGNDVNIDQKIDLPYVINSPINKGDVIGNVSYILNEEIICKTNLLADSDVPKIGFFSMESLIIKKWFNLLR